MRLLITGKHSYIGTSLEQWLSRWPDCFSVDSIDLTNDQWIEHSFAEYDAVFLVAAIVHEKEKPDMELLYQKVNCDLAIQVAKKAKADNVRHFIFMSSMSVYGISSGIINAQTKENPITLYGKSKLDAEIGLNRLADAAFTVSVIRAPMVYGGKACPGNYAKLEKFIRWSPIYPSYPNKRSFLHIDNLCEFIRLLLFHKLGGTLFPQNRQYISSGDMVREIAARYHKQILFVKIFNPIIRLFMQKSSVINSLFNDLVYDMSMSNYFEFQYCIHNDN